MNEIKEFKIEVPKGYCIDEENSTFERIKFKSKPIKVNYDTVATALFGEKGGFFIGAGGDVRKILGFHGAFLDPNNCTTENQGKKLLAINKLMNVAKYLNGDWKPNWYDNNEIKYCIYVCPKTNDILYYRTTNLFTGLVCFKTKELAQQAVNILGEDTILLAFSTNV